MFGRKSKRRRATEFAVEGLRPILGTVQYFHGLPPGFWADPYVLGFLQTTAALFCKQAVGRKVAGDGLRHTLADIFAVLSNYNGTVIAEAAGALMDKGDADYKRGADDAVVLHLYTFRVHRDEENDPLIIRATAALDAGLSAVIGSGDRRSQVAAAMLSLSLMNEVRERFGKR